MANRGSQALRGRSEMISSQELGGGGGFDGPEWTLIEDVVELGEIEVEESNRVAKSDLDSAATAYISEYNSALSRWWEQERASCH